VKEVLAKLPPAVEAQRAEKLLQILLREKNLVRVSAELVFHRQALVQLREQAGRFKKARGDRIRCRHSGAHRDHPEVRHPLLEYLDREHVTRRAGDERVIL